MEKLIKRIKLLDIRDNQDDMRLDLYSTLIPYILSKDVFNNNSDIKIFIETLDLKNEVKDYVYKSRTQIVAKLCREIEKSEKQSIIHNIKILKNHSLRLTNPKNEKAKKNIVDMINKYSRNR